MKFINYITQIARIDIYGLLSLLLFVIFFTVMLVWVFNTKKSTLQSISRIPLDQ